VVAELNSASAPAPYVAPGQVQQPAMPSESATASFVGRKYSYYEAKWTTPKFQRSKQSWNWAAFFGGMFWFAYRKMYAYAWVMVGLLVIDQLGPEIFHYNDSLTWPIFLVIWLMVGRMGNYLYKLHVDKLTAEIVATQSANNAQAELVRRGGTSIGAPFAFLGIYLVLVLCIVCAFHPDEIRAFFQ
jgi:hypothetical protein